jgi:holo-[acyl-carrier protein] synthase
MESSSQIGIDIVSIARVEKSYKRFGNTFMRRFFTDKEQEELAKKNEKSRVSSIAGKIAAKEAVMKVLGDGWPTISWTDIEIEKSSRGQPKVHLYNRAIQTATLLNIKSVIVSITHDAGLAIAVVLGVAKAREGCKL